MTPKEFVEHQGWDSWDCVEATARLGVSPADKVDLDKTDLSEVELLAWCRERAANHATTEEDLPVEEEVYGWTFEGWLRAAGREDSTSEYDLRAAWRAGEEPEDYAI